ncbi:membrane protein [Vibrio harveyi]|nr:membrane protein [Vibrio harveyi]
MCLYLALTIGLAISLSIWNEWFSLSQRIDLDTYFTLFGAITATVICVPNILTISKGLSIAAKVNLVTIAFILLTCSVNFIITNGSTVSSSLGTLLSVISLMLYKSPLYQAFLAHFNSLHFKKP